MASRNEFDALHAGDAGKRKLMIVESRTKAKEITAFLPSNWTVLPSNGFIKDIIQPKKVPKDKHDEYGRYGIRLTDFDTMLDYVPRGATTLSSIRKALSSNVDVLVISTDPDRAGDSIGTQLVESLRTDIKRHGITVYRASWHEITRTAIVNGLTHASDITAMRPGADADTARAVYDRLFGYSVSPFLWKAVGTGTSGGRAQSPALRLIVSRERERMAFVPVEYHGIDGVFRTRHGEWPASLVSIDGRRVATGSSFDAKGNARKGDIVLDGDTARTHAGIMMSSSWVIDDIKDKAYRRTPPRPYKTSTFQQDVGTRLGLSSKVIMSIAQKLFENAIISYHRTDAEVMSKEGIDAARRTAIRDCGRSSVPSSPRSYTAKAGAQEGHEGIRPIVDEATGLFPSPSSLRSRLNGIDRNAYKVYDLIYRRSAASQMNDAIGRTVTIMVRDSKDVYLMSSVGTRITEPGWTMMMGDRDGVVIPDVVKGEDAVPVSMTPSRHETQPPARFTEPQLVARLEELGIGRPATYSQIVSVNQERGYVAKRGRALYPTFRGMQVAAILESLMPGFVDYSYTSTMETDLDDIVHGTMSRSDFLSREWSRIDSDVNGLSKSIDWGLLNSLSTIDLGNGYRVRCMRKGFILEDSHAVPDKDGRVPGAFLEGDELGDGLDADKCAHLIEDAGNNGDSRVIGVIQDGDRKGMTARMVKGRYGWYVGLSSSDGKRKESVSLMKGMVPEDVGMDDVMRILAPDRLPRRLGDGYFVGIGKRGAWIGWSDPKRRKSRARFVGMPDGMDPHTVSLEDARAEFMRRSKSSGKK